MRTRLSDWASIAEIGSGIAVVVTLVFLLVGIRENTEVVRASSYDRNIQSLVDWRMSILQDPDSVRVFGRYFLEDHKDESSLSVDDRARLRLILGALWVSWEKAYFAQEYGLLGESEWNRFARRVCVAYREDPEIWKGYVSNFVTDEFVGYVMSTCEIAVD